MKLKYYKIKLQLKNKIFVNCKYESKKSFFYIIKFILLFKSGKKLKILNNNKLIAQ